MDVITLDDYLPDSVTEGWQGSTDIARWLTENGFRVIATGEIPLRHAHATTACGMRVYADGWVCKAPVINATS